MIIVVISVPCLVASTTLQQYAFKAPVDKMKNRNLKFLVSCFEFQMWLNDIKTCRGFFGRFLTSMLTPASLAKVHMRFLEELVKGTYPDHFLTSAMDPFWMGGVIIDFFDIGNSNPSCNN